MANIENTMEGIFYHAPFKRKISKCKYGYGEE